MSSSWHALVSYSCEITSKRVTIVVGSGGLITGKCDEPCDHECHYNAARPEVPLPTPPETAPAAASPTRVTRKPRAATPPEPKTPLSPTTRKEKPKKCKVKPPKEESSYDHFKLVPPRSEDLLIVKDQVLCPKKSTIVTVDLCRASCGSHIATIRHSGTKEPHIRCASAKGVKIVAEEGAMA